MKTTIISVTVTCPKCRTRYTERYLPLRALPEEIGNSGYSGDCVVATCPSCDNRISTLVQMVPGPDPA